jgi:DnaJ-class molecular chaperone
MEGILYEQTCLECNGTGKRWITKNATHMHVQCYKCFGRGTILVNWIENIFGRKYK